MIEWMPLIGAIGIGAIATKLMDILWLQNATRATERIRWIREQRLKAYTSLAKELLTLGIESRIDMSTAKAKALIVESILLTDDKALVVRIIKFTDDLAKLRTKTQGDISDEVRKEGFVDYLNLSEEAYAIVDELRKKIIA